MEQCVQKSDIIFPVTTMKHEQKKAGASENRHEQQRPIKQTLKMSTCRSLLIIMFLTHQYDVTEDAEDGSGGWMLLAPPEVKVTIPLDHDVLPVRPLLPPSSDRSFIMTIQVISQHYP